MEEPKDFSKGPESYHWAPAIFIYLFKNLRNFLKLLGPITDHLLFLFIYLFISVSKFLATTVNKKFS